MADPHPVDARWTTTIRFDLTFRHAVSIARRAGVADPENLAGDMIEECVRAMRENRIDAPTRHALVVACRTARARGHLTRYEYTKVVVTDSVEAFGGGTPDPIERSWSLTRLQAVWPTLTETEREALTAYLSGAEYDEARRKTLDNARRNAVAKLRGKTVDTRFQSCGNRRRRL